MPKGPLGTRVPLMGAPRDGYPPQHRGLAGGRWITTDGQTDERTDGRAADTLEAEPRH